MCLGWLYHHLWDLARAGTREAQCASWAQYDTALEQSLVCWTTIRRCGGAATSCAATVAAADLHLRPCTVLLPRTAIRAWPIIQL